MDYTFISGATGGIGKAFCLTLIKTNANLFITGRSEEKLKELKGELLSVNPESTVEYFACDLTEKTERQKLYSFIEEKGIKFERLINVAGVDTQKAFILYTEDKLDFQVRVNVESTISITNFVLKHRADGLEIITIGSMSGVSPMPYFAIYSASKKMLESFFTALRYELSKSVKITVVMPGGVYTREDIKEEIKSQGLWGRLTAKTPEYIAVNSLKKVKKNKAKYIPGFFNRLLYFLMKIAPKKTVLKYIAKRWKTHSKDAF